MKPKRVFTAFAALTLAFLCTFVPCLPCMAEPADEDTSPLELVPDGESLPRIDITTDSGSAVTKKEYEGASMQMTLTDRFADYQNDYTDEDGGRITIKCRGNTSYDLNKTAARTGKYSYKIRLDEKADLLGMGKSRHFALIANIFDMTSMRNKLTYDLSGMLGMLYSQSRWVVVYMNGEYRGLYSLVESIRIEDGRVDITDWNSIAKKAAKAVARGNDLSDEDTDALIERMQDDLSWVTSGTFESYNVSEYYDLSGLSIDSGYLIEYDNRQDGDGYIFKTSKDKPLEIVKPNGVSTNEDMINYVKRLFDSFEEAIYSKTFCTEDGRHYSEFVDYDSLVDYFLINELFKNTEFGYLSIFMYIEGGKIYFGLCWDIDCSSGNQVTLFKGHMSTDGWMITGDHGEWWKKLCTDPLYQTRVANRWFEISPYVDEMIDSMSVYYKYIYEESLPNFKQNRPYNWYITKEIVKSFDAEYEALYTWLCGRVEWLDETMAKREPTLENSGPATSAKITLTLSGADGELAAADRTLGAYTDYYISTTAGAITLTVETKHSTQKYADIYINGIKLGRYDSTKAEPLTVTIDPSMLDLTSGAANVIRVVALSKTETYYKNNYVTLTAADGRVDDTRALVCIDNSFSFVEKGSSLVVPMIDKTGLDGYNVRGWSDGENVIPEGETMTVTGDVRLQISLERTDLYPDGVVTEPTEPPISTDPPITIDPPTTTVPPTTTTTPSTTPPTTTQPPTTSTPPTTTDFEPIPLEPSGKFDSDTKFAAAIVLGGISLLTIGAVVAIVSRKLY